MIHSFDEANKKIEKIKTLNQAELRDLVEFLIRKGVIVKVDKYGTSVQWEEATDSIVTLIKHLIVSVGD